MLDQAMSSASNGLIVLAVARVASVDAFGTATLLFAISAGAMGVGRGAIGTPIMLAAGRGHAELRREAGFATAATLVFGFAVSCGAAVSSILLGAPGMGAAFVVAIPLVIVVDVFRYTLISASKPQVALAWDALWAIGSALLFLSTLFWRYAISDVAIVFCWATLAGISALGLALSFRVHPRVSGLGSWWRATYGSRIRYGIEAGLAPINVLIILSVATALIGASAAASLRGASTILSPLAVLLSALPLVVIPESVRRGASVTEVWSKLCRIGFPLSLLVIAVGIGSLVLPERVGQLILGDTWEFARVVLPIIAFEYFGLVWSAIGMGYLRFQGKSGHLLALTVGQCVTQTVLCTALAFLTRTAVGVAAGLAVTAVALAAGIVLYVRPVSLRLGDPPRG
jgi:hypothetical protein